MSNTKFQVDSVNAVIRGVSVITAGLIARGHDLEVDSVTLEQMKACAEARTTVPVRVDHKSGAGAVCGYLENFKITGEKLTADWQLLKTHPQTEQILETAVRMPAGVGLSAAFLAPADAPKGKARCSELVSVDYVALPAANPGGLFATINGELIEFSAAGATLRGLGRAAKVGIASGLIRAGKRVERATFTLPKIARPITRRAIIDAGKAGWEANKPQITSIAGRFVRDVAVTGAGVLAVSEIQRRQRAIEDRRAAERARRRLALLSAKLDVVLLARRPALDRLADAADDNLPRPEVPYKEQAGLAKRVWQSDAARAARLRLARIGLLAGGGGLAAHRYLKPPGSWKVGAGIGAAAGILFAARESHSPESLAKRLGMSRDKIHELTAAGALNGRDFGHPAGLLAFDTGELTAIQLSYPPREEEPSTLAKAGKVAAIGAGALAAGSLLRGAAVLGPQRAAQAGLIATGRFGARKLTRDAAGILERAKAAMAFR